MKQEEFLCMSANGKSVVFDPVGSHASTHFHDAPGLRGEVVGLIKSLVLESDLIARDYDMGRVIGNNNVVEIDDTDELVYAMRKLREDQGYVAFTKSQSSAPCTKISVHLIQLDEDTYNLYSTWVGEYESPPFPQMKIATAESIPFWSKHAFVWGSQEIIPGTETAECPW